MIKSNIALSTASRLLNEKTIAAIKLKGGKNSIVYSVSDTRDNNYLVKFYFRHDRDPRDRLKVEFTSLNFLWKNGVRCIPQPLIADENLQCAIYTYIEGQKIAMNSISDSDIGQVVAFSEQLRKLGRVQESRTLPPASEACFSIGDIVKNLKQRLSRLLNIENKNPEYEALSGFLKNEFIPCFKKTNNGCLNQADRMSIPFNGKLSRNERVLSTSDFGFHNAIKDRDGRIFFVDFEYFGWDDPSKTICDFLLHPAMNLNHKLKNAFFRSMVHTFGDLGALPERTKIVYPLFGLKWCLILLNEFVPEFMSRRIFSMENDTDQKRQLTMQLKKARNFMKKIRRSHASFPYAY